MPKSIKYKAYHRPTKTWYWFDVMWGNHHGYGSGYIGMLPLKTERQYARDNRIPVDPTECTIKLMK
jgi:hypothetical protein